MEEKESLFGPRPIKWGVQWDPPSGVFERWQPELDRLFPPNQSVSHLRLVWEPGDPWEHIGRWIIYVMVPFHRANELARISLLGPHPRSRGRYDHVKRQFYPDPACFVTRTQWELFHETGYYGYPYWVCQGDRGGHRYNFTRIERIVSVMHGGPEQPPAPGDLPYAEPDMRTIWKLAELDRMRAYRRMVDFALRRPEDLDAEEEEAARQVREAIWRWLDTSITDAFEEFPRTTRLKAAEEAFELSANVPSFRDPVDPEKGLEELHEDLINDGWGFC